MELYGNHYAAAQLRGYVSSLRNLGGILPFEFTEGPARGMRGLEVTNAAGLRYYLLPDRALDIGQAFFREFPLAWRSGRGESRASREQGLPLSFLEVFGGGLLTTCGFEHIGAPATVAGKPYPLHGSLHRESAEQLAWTEEPTADGIDFVIRGVINQAEVFGAHYHLVREIRTPLTRNTITLTDRVTNHGSEPVPLFVLYHFNFGFPLVSPASRIEAQITKTTPRTEHAAAGLARALELDPPAAAPCPEQVYFHDLTPDAAGDCRVRLINPELNEGHGIAMQMHFAKAALPHFTQWKSMLHGTYVLGLEPSNAPLAGREALEKGEPVPLLAPGETREFRISLTLGRI